MKLINGLIFLVIVLIFSTRAKAQLIPDATLGAESSTVNAIDGKSDRIDNGAIRETNLFHSFSEFNVSEGRGVFFNSPENIQNIITRITGSNASNILGKLGVLGEANLFLINPNGIIFGQNASLNVRGSFVSTTANALKFGEQGFFSATNPETSSLLTIQPSALFFNQLNSGGITNNSVAPAGQGIKGLRVADGSSLLMIGGDVILNGGKLQARGGQIELGGLQGQGVIELNMQNQEFNLVFPTNAILSNVSLNQGAKLNVREAEGGSIAINAQNLDLKDVSFLLAGINEGEGSIDSQAGNIDINVNDTMNITNNSFIVNNIQERARGNGGDINIKTGSLISNQSFITTKPEGQGNAGNITLTAQNLISLNKGSFFDSGTENSGKGGNITLTAQDIWLDDSSSLFSSTFGSGSAGNITLTAQNLISLNKGSFFDSSTENSGKGGNITLTAQDIWLDNSSSLFSSTFGPGIAGNITLTAQNLISLDRSSRIFSSTDTNSSGNAGDINLDAQEILLDNGSRLEASTFGLKNAGNINLIAQDKITINGEATAEQNNDVSSSGVFSNVETNATGNGGIITITTGSLSLTNGGQIVVNAFGQGNAGRVDIEARDTASFDGVGSVNFESGVFSGVSVDTVGDSGKININANSLSLSNSAVINAETSGEGNGGDIVINANNLSAESGGQIFTTSRGNGNAGDIRLHITESLNLSGTSPIDVADLAKFKNAGPSSGLFANTESESNSDGGNIFINGSDSMKAMITDNAQITASNAGTGKGGKIQLKGKLLILDRGEITTKASGNKGGNIILELQDLLLLRNNSQINASAGNNSGAGDGGNIDVDVNFIVAMPNENSDIIANAFSGRGGAININAVGIFGISELSREELIELQKTDNTNVLEPSQVNSSDITALSQTNASLNGQINLSTLEIEPSRQLFLLPTQPLNAQIAQTCTPGTKEARSEFGFIGRGGITPNTLEVLQIHPSIPDWLELPSQSAKSSPKLSTPNYSQSAKIIEAQGWIRDENGEVILVADAANVTPHDSWQQPKQCAHN